MLEYICLGGGGEKMDSGNADGGSSGVPPKNKKGGKSVKGGKAVSKGKSLLANDNDATSSSGKLKTELLTEVEKVGTVTLPGIRKHMMETLQTTLYKQGTRR